MLGSVSTRSTGFSSPKISYTNLQNNNDDANPHPMAPANNPGMGPTVTKGEYQERQSPGIQMMGVGNMSCNDAACEKMATHPSAEDLSQAGSMGGGAKAMRR